MSRQSKKILFDEHEIAAAVRRMASEMRENHPEGGVVFIGILKGAFVLLADLIRSFDRPCEVDFARIASYGSGTVSSGRVDVRMDVQTPIEGRSVILVDDIVDTGLTLSEYRRMLLDRGPASVEIAALIDKSARREKQVDVDYYGFRIEDGFVVGYGLDCDEQYRNLCSICVLEDTNH